MPVQSEPIDSTTETESVIPPEKGVNTPYVGAFDEMLLTEEERSALSDDLDVPDTYDPDAEAGAGDDVPMYLRDAQPGDGEPEAQAIATPATGQAAQPSADFVPPPIPAKVDHTAAITDLATKEADLRASFADGQVSDDEFAEQIKAIAKESAKLEVQQDTYDEQVAAARAAGDAAFNAAVAAHKVAHGALYADDILPVFNKHVMTVTADPSNSRLTFTQQLEKAQKLLAVDIDRPDLAPTPPAAQKTAANPPAATQPANTIPRVQPVPTLASIPASDPNSASESIFAALDALQDSGQIERHEAALMRLTPDQRDQYERMAY